MSKELAIGDKTGKFSVKFDFTSDRQDDLKAGIWPATVGMRIIKAELGLEPGTINRDGDVRYYTDDANIFAELLKICMCHSDGGWFTIDPMPTGSTVFILPHKTDGKYSNE